MDRDLHDLYVFKEKQFSIGIDRGSGKYYVSFFQVTTDRRSAFEVYYELPEAYLGYIDAASPELEDFVNQCRRGLHVALQLQP